MKTHPWNTTIAVLLLLLAGLHIAAAQTPRNPAPADSPDAEPQTVTEDTATPPGTEEAAPEAPPEAVAGSSPFAYQLPADSRGFLPRDDVAMPRDIKVLAIIMVAGRPPLAALEVPGYDEPFYVTEQDIVCINAPQPRSGTRGPADNGPVESGLLYLEVGGITSQHVELFPRTNPTSIQILR